MITSYEKYLTFYSKLKKIKKEIKPLEKNLKDLKSKEKSIEKSLKSLKVEIKNEIIKTIKPFLKKKNEFNYVKINLNKKELRKFNLKNISYITIILEKDQLNAIVRTLNENNIVFVSSKDYNKDEKYKPSKNLLKLYEIVKDDDIQIKLTGKNLGVL